MIQLQGIPSLCVPVPESLSLGAVHVLLASWPACMATFMGVWLCAQGSFSKHRAHILQA